MANYDPWTQRGPGCNYSHSAFPVTRSGRSITTILLAIGKLDIDGPQAKFLILAIAALEVGKQRVVITLK